MKIMLDAGHGPNTPGKRSPDGMREFEFNSRVADVMKAELEKYEGVTVYFAHDPKRDVPLKERTDKANALKVDVYVSLHANANTGVMGSWGGIDTFIYSTASKAKKLADVVQRNLIAATGLRNRGVKTANFHVLRETNMPAILIEHGFMDSTTDLPKLKSDSYRVLCGQTNAKSLAEVYGLKLKAVQVARPKDDVKGHWAAESIKKAKACGAMNGYQDGTFRPDAAMTRAEFATVLDKLGLFDKGAN